MEIPAAGIVAAVGATLGAGLTVVSGPSTALPTGRDDAYYL